MSLITLGTMAFDAIETPFGKIDKIVGGSATYVAYAASHLVRPVQQISIVGNDFPQSEMEELKKRGVELEGVEIVPDKKGISPSPCEHSKDMVSDEFFPRVREVAEPVLTQLSVPAAIENTTRYQQELEIVKSHQPQRETILPLEQMQLLSPEPHTLSTHTLPPLSTIGN